YLCLSHSRICSCTHVLSARIYTLSLHDALPICCHSPGISNVGSSTTRPVSSWWLTNCTVAPRLVPPRSDGKTCRSLVASHGVHRWVVLFVVIQRINSDSGFWVTCLGDLAVTDVHGDVVNAGA